MDVVAFSEAETYEPEDGWRRIALAGSERFSFEYFEKPVGHASPLHHHENEQVCVCLDGELTVETETTTATLGRYDSVYLEPDEPHLVENTGTEPAIGLDVFAPGRDFEFWTEDS